MMFSTEGLRKIIVYMCVGEVRLNRSKDVGNKNFV